MTKMNELEQRFLAWADKAYLLTATRNFVRWDLTEDSENERLTYFKDFFDSEWSAVQACVGEDEEATCNCGHSRQEHVAYCAFTDKSGECDCLNFTAP
jgi:hypothetical protein